MTVQDKRQTVIEAVSKALITSDGHIYDGRIGFTLKRMEYAEKSSSWGKNGYFLNTEYDGQLRSGVYKWCELNGLKEQADEFNARARASYWRSNAARWMQQCGQLRLDLAQLEKMIARYQPADFYKDYYGYSLVEEWVFDLAPIAGEDLPERSYVSIGKDGKLYVATKEQHDAETGVAWMKGEIVTAYAVKDGAYFYLLRAS